MATRKVVWDIAHFKGDIIRHASSSNHFDLIISWLPNIVQIFFCTQYGAMDPTFQMKYIPSGFDGDTDHKTHPTFF